MDGGNVATGWGNGWKVPSEINGNIVIEFSMLSMVLLIKINSVPVDVNVEVVNNEMTISVSSNVD